MVSTSIPTGNAVVKKDLFNVPVTATTNIFGSDIIPNHNPIAFLSIYASFLLGGTLTLIRTSSGISVTETLNGGAALAPATSYSFSIPISSIETINMQYSATTTALRLVVTESIEEV